MLSLQRIAVLIDADNTHISKLNSVLRELSTKGRIVLKRAYGNWKKANMKNWEREMKRLSIKAVQQFDYVPGKNTTDMALVIDAMDLLHTGIYDAFAIVASDSDYTPIAIKLRESAAWVIGVGERQTPEAFRNSCDEFVYLENLTSGASLTTTVPNKVLKIVLDEIHDLLKAAHENYKNEEGYVLLSSAGSYLIRTKQDFDLRIYGYAKLIDLLKAYPDKYHVKSHKIKGQMTIYSYKCLEASK